MKVDFFARRMHFIDHLAPVWKALKTDARGDFFVLQYLWEYAQGLGLDAVAVPPRMPADRLSGAPNGPGPLLTCAYMDMLAAYKVRPQRPFILMEHGVGLTFKNPSYAGSMGLRRRVSLFLVPNEHTRAMNARVLPLTPQAVIGVPKMDDVANGLISTLLAYEPVRKPVVCVSFHWDGKHIAPEAGNAFAHYGGILPELARQEAFTLIGHGHPKFPQLRDHFAALGIEFVEDFREVLKRADLYVNDCSSTLYEFLITGKPVVILNAPQFRRNLQQGIRFWEYADVGPQVNEPDELLPTILDMLVAPGEYEAAQDRAIEELYPFLGQSAARAAKCIEDFLQSRWPASNHVDQIDGETVGILYMGFGAKAALDIQKSMASLKRIGLEIPVAVVGDTPVRGAQLIRWSGESPFDAAQRRNFQFRAGRIKPHLCELTPFDRTLYIDADTEFMADILAGFELLGEYDMALAEELLSVGQLYNRPRAGWEINILERDATIKELGGNRHMKFLNSGVMFFRKCGRVTDLFEEWGLQWRRWQQWDEQLALMRALNKCVVHYKALSVDWNHPHREQAKIIFHNYGRGTARSNVNG